MNSMQHRDLEGSKLVESLTMQYKARALMSLAPFAIIHCPLKITNYSCTPPNKRVVALVPVHTDCISGRCGTRSMDTYKLLLPAIRGCVAQEPPSTMLCFPSKKSASKC